MDPAGAAPEASKRPRLALQRSKKRTPPAEQAPPRYRQTNLDDFSDVRPTHAASRAAQRNGTASDKPPQLQPIGANVVASYAELVQRKRRGKAKRGGRNDYTTDNISGSERGAMPLGNSRAGMSATDVVFCSEPVLRMYDGTADEPEAPEVRTGQIPPYPVTRPYHLGGLGRYGIDGKFESARNDTNRGSANEARILSPPREFTPINPRIAGVTEQSLPQFSPMQFQSDGFIHLNDEVEDGGEDEMDKDEEYKDRMEVDADQDEDQNAESEDTPGKHYRFNFGQYKGTPFSDVLSDVNYLKMIGGQPALLNRRGGDLRSAFEYYCPQYIAKSTRNNANHLSAASIPNVPMSNPLSRSSLPVRNDRPRTRDPKHPKDYVFDFGKYSGTRFDEAPGHYLQLIEGQVRKGLMDKRAGLREAYEWHWWGGKNE